MICKLTQNFEHPQADRRRATRALKTVDWNALDALSDADIDRQVAANPDAAPGLDCPRPNSRRPLACPWARCGIGNSAVPSPYGFARVLLRVIECHPNAVLRLLRQ